MRNRAWIAIALGLVLLGAGCANRGGAAGTSTASARGGDAAAPAHSAEVSRWARAGEPGLEVVLWSTSADLATFAQALAPYAAADAGSAGPPGGLSPEAVALWATHGFRVLRVPVRELEPLRIALGAPDRSVSQRLGQALVWTELVGGPMQARGQTIALEAERLPLGPGRLRLLARAWVSPAPRHAGSGAPGAAMTIELLPQHDEERPRSVRADLLGETSIAATDEGQLFPRLLLRLRATSSDDAIVLVPFPPASGIVEAAASAPPPQDPSPADGGAPTGVGQLVRTPPSSTPAPANGQPGEPAEGFAGGGFDATPQAGPPAARAPALGEAMLGPPVWVAPRRRQGQTALENEPPRMTTPRRMVVVLVPRLPERVTLMP